MQLRIFMEWNPECGLTLDKMYPLREGIEDDFKEKVYGDSINQVLIVLICRPKKFKQRKLYKKTTGVFSYDIFLDFLLIKNVELEQKKKLISYEIKKISKETFSKYKFVNFDKLAFLNDLDGTIDAIQW